MRYLKRLKNELQDLTERLTAKGPNHEYATPKKLNRQLMLRIIISLIQKVREVDHATDNWAQGNAEAWIDFRANLEGWLEKFPKVPEKVVERGQAAAE